MKSKRILAFILALVMVFSLVACSSGSLGTETEEPGTEAKTSEDTKKNEKRDPTGFAAGFAREKITPTFPTGMGGFGNTDQRRSTTVSEDIYASCICISDGETKALFFSIDVLSVSDTNCDNIYRRVEKEFGIPKELVTISATHNHAGPNVSSNADSVANYMSIFYTAVMKTAREAVADLDRCEMKIGSTRTQDLNYVRRYFREDGTFAGANYNHPSTSPIVRHETEVDNEMQLLVLDRVNAKDIVMVNWPCHVTTAGGSENTKISADWVGYMREEAEENADIYVSYHQGAAGNVTPVSMVTTDKDNSNYSKHGKEVGQAILEGLENLTPVESGKIRGISRTVECQYDKDVSMYNVEHAMEVKRYYNSGDRTTATRLAQEYGFDSMYHANEVAQKSNRIGTGLQMPLYAVAIGDIGFAVAPYEMFDTNGMQIKNGSSFTMTFVCAYAGNYGYIPAEGCWPNGGYEVGTCPYVRGTGEMIANELISMLEELK